MNLAYQPVVKVGTGCLQSVVRGRKKASGVFFFEIRHRKKTPDPFFRTGRYSCMTCTTDCYAMKGRLTIKPPVPQPAPCPESGSFRR